MSQQRQQRGAARGSGGSNANAGRPWRLCLIRPYTDRSGAEKTHFLAIGALFKNEQGFSADAAGLHVDLQRGDRLALFPPDDGDE